MEPTTATPSSQSDPKLMAALAWIFSPFSSYLLKDDKDSFVKEHAHESFYFGLLTLVASLASMFVSVCFYTAIAVMFSGPVAVIGSFLSCGWMLINLAILAGVVIPRLIGAVKALNNEPYALPSVRKFVEKYFKLR